MRTVTGSVVCPECGRRATIVMAEHIDEVGDLDAHEIMFVCSDPDHQLSAVEAIRLWVTDRAAAG